jgi:HD-like signal output (HDOD) protein/CheY-like chemotaxis protein
MKKLCILFVDDEPNILKGMQRVLRSQRNTWDFLFASGGVEALELMQHNAVDVLVSDMLMPGMNGFELLEKVSKQYPSVIRIILSGQTSRTSNERAIYNTHLFLSKPCPAELLISTLERVTKIKQSLSNEKLQIVINKMHSLPGLPSVYLKLVEILESDKSSIKSIAQLVEQDIAISTKIIQIVNSAFFSLSSSISSVEHAVNLLGIETISSLVLTTEVFSTVDETILERFNLQKVWDHGIFASGVVRLISKEEKLSKQVTENATLSALLFDIGKLVLATQYSEHYYPVYLKNKDDGGNLLLAEKQAFGCDHADVGGYLLGIWGLPFVVVESVTNHHFELEKQLLSSQIDCSLLANIANLLAHQAIGNLSCYDQQLSHLIKLNHPMLSAAKIQKWQQLTQEMLRDK